MIHTEFDQIFIMSSTIVYNWYRNIKNWLDMQCYSIKLWYELVFGCRKQLKNNIWLEFATFDLH